MSLTVNANQVVRTVDERVFGVNAVMWDGQSGSAQTVSLVEAAGLRAIRIPGGSLSDEYHWRTNTNLSNTWTWASGFDSFIKLITGLNAQAYVTVNYGTGTPEEAAAWVAYSNSSASILGTASDVAIGVDAKGYDWKTAGYWSALRNSAPLATNDGMNFLRISRASPLGLKYWEIGNECYGTWETDQQAVPHDPYTYAIRSKAYIAKMKAVDASIKIGVVAVTGETSNTNNTNHPATNPRTGVVRNGWTPVMLTTLKAAPTVTPDYLIYHRYEQAPAADQPANPESDANLLQKAKTWPQDAADLRQQLADYLGSAGAGVELAVTENNSVYGKPGKQTTSLVNGLFYADSVGNLLQTEFNSLLWWDLRNGQENTNNNSASLYGWRQYGDYGILSTPSSFGSATAYEPYPTYYVMKLLSKFARNGDTVVQASSNNTLLSIFAVKRTDGSLSLLVINKDRNVAQNSTISLQGFSPLVETMVHSYGIAQDEAMRTGAGSIDLSTTTEILSGGSFSRSFPPYSATVISILPNLSATAASDFNSDGKADVIWQNRVTGERYIYLMNGANFLAGASLGTVGLDWNAAATGDFNGDGKTDVVWENRVTGERYIYLMSGTTFMSGVNLGTVPPEWWIVVAADFNGDGKTDIIWENRLTGEHYLYLMNGTTVSSAVDLGTVSLEWTMGGAGDFTGDGKPDLLWQNIATGEQKVQAMNGTVPGAYTMLGTYYDLQIAGSGDFNNDGKADILLTNLVTGERTIRLMNGVTPLGTASLGTVGFEWVLNRQVPLRVPVDFNADGRSDVVWQNNVTGERYVYLMNGVSFNSGYTLILPASIDWKVAASADFNRDGKPDLVGENIVTGERCIWLMNAGTVNSTVSLGTTATQWSIAAATDMNSDGQPDVVWQNTSTGARRIDLMNGTTVSSTITLTLPASNQWRIAATADFNRDGKPDLVGQNTTSGESCIWLMNGSTVNATVTLGAAVGSQWSIATTVDLNSDGYPDVLWQNTVTGERYIYLMNYYTFVSAVSLGTIPTPWSICR